MTTACKLLFYYLIFSPVPCFAQWYDSFDDGELMNKPSWLGHVSHFVVNPNKQLTLNAPAVSGESYLITASKVSSVAVWKFRVQLDFNPSSVNYAKVFLMSNVSCLDSSLAGYYVKVGGTDDDISLYRQDGSVSKLLIDGKDGMLAADVNRASVQVTRSSKGEWLVSCDTTGNSNYIPLGSSTDSTYWVSNYFGVQCIYTSTRCNKFQFDDFAVSGMCVTDNVFPKIEVSQAIEDTAVQVTFSESMDISTLRVIRNYLSSSVTKVQSIFVKDDRNVILYFSDIIPCNQNLDVIISKVTDLAGNALSDTTVHLSYCPGSLFDVVISELMADPDPPVRLPNYEYIELYNRSGITINLNKWSLQVGKHVIRISAVNLPADSFLVFTSKGGCNAYNRQNLCLESLPSNCLNNDGEYVGLKNAKNSLIHWVNYTDQFYLDKLKQTGGWSLEMIDYQKPCAGIANWRASNNPNGGSPWDMNGSSQTIADPKVFQWTKIFLLRDSILRLHFSKPVDVGSVSKEKFTVEPYGSPVEVKADSLEHLYLDICFPDPFQPGLDYSLEVSESISDCSGNLLKHDESIPFMLPDSVSRGDIIINEVLFNALPGGSEFIELYNKSNKYISSTDIRFAYHNNGGNYTSTFNPGDPPFLIAPHDYLVVTHGKDGVVNQYHVPDERFIEETSSFPALSNDEGCVALMNTSLEILDEFCYNAKMHFPLLDNTAGVSLERIRINAASTDPSNWHSASSSEGYATPGAKNSQFLSDIETGSEVTLETEIFSPDNDGYKDVETIIYKLDQPGYSAQIIVFDALGRRIKIIANNTPLSTEGTFTWDGIDEKGQLAPTGIYLIYTEMHNQSGIVKQFKNTCVLGGELRR